MRYVDGDYKSLEEYFEIRLNAKLKQSIEIACILKTIFTGQSKDNKFKISKYTSDNIKTKVDTRI